MGERKQEVDNDAMDDFYDPILGDMGDDILETLTLETELSDQAKLAAKRRKAERRLEALRLREELGDYDFDFDDDY
jgi:mevalonate kinase